MSRDKIILIGGGGHCKSCIDVIEQENKYTISGIIDLKEKIGQKVLSYKIIGSDDDLNTLVKEYEYFFITIGQISNSKTRENIFYKLKKLGCKFPTIISPKAYVSKTACIGEGTIIMHGAIINSEASIGYNTIINSNTLIEHETIIGNNTHVSTSCVINGQCKIGSNVFIGSSSTLINNVSLVDNVIIGASSLVTKNLAEQGTYIGTPAKNRQ